MTKFIALGENWEELISKKDVEMILMTCVPDNDALMDNMVAYLQKNHPALFVSSYYYNEHLVLGILKPVPDDLKDLVQPDTIVAKKNEHVLEVKTKDVIHITIVKEKDTNALFTRLNNFLQLSPNRKNKIFNKNQDDKRD